MSSPTLVQEAAQRVRAAAETPVASISAADWRVIKKFLVVGAVVALALGVETWTQMQVRSTAVALGEVRAQVQKAEIEQGRLKLEHTTLRAAPRLRAAATELGLVPPVAIVELRAP